MLGDQAETAAIKTVFGDTPARAEHFQHEEPVGPSAGGQRRRGVGLSTLALRDGVIPPTINYHKPDPLCDLDYTPNQAREKKLDVAMSNSFGFGGHNACLAVGRLRNGV